MKQKTAHPAITEIGELPADVTMTVPPEWEDRNGHVNVQYYLTLYELGGWQMLEQLGIDESCLSEQRVSIFDLEHHITYLAEIRVGDVVSVHNRMLSRNSKLFQGMFFVVNVTRQQLAATIEYLSICIDMDQRRASAFPEEISGRLDELHARHSSMGWSVPVSGLMDL
ncbi:thioesterase [Seongchinamella sediminis]|uniref:Thioesterase n=1 Tax=Seongchinamella sediminis TaxID=2283635 RepID=A0A3L7DXQ3_9GAMM|nr:thioesterase family protein [Seongchinamella sediminis]RLQ21966.1 thioesterase [Seongchinamella sediminis]